MSEPVRPIALGDVPAEGDERTVRTAQFVGAMLRRIWETMTEFECGYDEYDAAKQWLIDVGQAGEWPLFLDVFFERVVEQVAAARTDASQSSIQGPFYVPGAPLVQGAGAAPMRADEPGERLRVHGHVRSTDGSPIAGAVVDHWQADSDGFYSSFHPSVPVGNLRLRCATDSEGRYAIDTVMPAPYRIPHDGPTGQLLAAGGWHPWRPAHLHYFVDADGHDRLTTQLFFAGDPYLGVDVAGADKPDLIVTPTRAADGTLDVAYDFVLQPGAHHRLGHSAEARA